ncbi:hypothetical protein AO382_1386 [Moraxella catarrhalis]|uniref:WYL domain-containing protein n=2 Tax=Moraxellaceae TaxID=468 RepID=A0A7Z0UXS4_MORCA|nr:hypothetical protein AO382_1386 [Moraxella catarrhalis]
MPDGGIVEPSAIDIIGMLAGVGAVIWLIIRSAKIGKARKASPVIDSTTDQPPIILQTAEESIPEFKEADAEAHMLIEQEAKIRAEQDQTFAKEQQAINDRIAALEAELLSTRMDLSQTREQLDDIKPKPKPQPPKPEAKADLELGEDKVCLMEYRDSKGAVSTRPIIPRALKANQSGNWVVSAVDINANRVKSFRVDRIECLAHNGQAWTDQDDILGVIRTLETVID